MRPRSKVRRQIAFEAAQLMYRRQESEYYRAKMKAARRICQGWVKPSDLPSNSEIRDQVQMLSRIHEGDTWDENLMEMRFEAIRMMRTLCAFRPRLIGSVLDGHTRTGSDIDIHLFADGTAGVAAALEREGVRYDIERKRVRKNGVEQTYTHIHIEDRFPFELTVYPSRQEPMVSKSSITGKPMARASIAELEQLLQNRYPDQDLEHWMTELAERPDRWVVFESLLLPLERVKQNPHFHPEGDALYHSLQVYDLARDALPYDEEFLLAALLHDVGKAIDSHDHVAAGLEALDGLITDRSYWLIEHHMLAHQLRDRSLGVRARRRLEKHPSFEELVLLGECDRGGRCSGVEVPTIEEALDQIRALHRIFSD